MAQELECGAEVTSDVALEAPLIGCSAASLVIATDGIAIDLNGPSQQIRFAASPGPKVMT